MLNTRLKIPSAVHSVVFRRMDSILRVDPICSRTFISQRSWRDDDKGASLLPWASNLCPGWLMTPYEGAEKWYGPDGFNSELLIDVEVGARGTNPEDLFDLVQLFRRAFYPPDHTISLTIQEAIKASGASQTGQPLFNASGIPKVSRDEAGTFQFASFTIRIDTLNIINP